MVQEPASIILGGARSIPPALIAGWRRKTDALAFLWAGGNVICLLLMVASDVINFLPPSWGQFAGSALFVLNGLAVAWWCFLDSRHGETQTGTKLTKEVRRQLARERRLFLKHPLAAEAARKYRFPLLLGAWVGVVPLIYDVRTAVVTANVVFFSCVVFATLFWEWRPGAPAKSAKGSEE